MNQQELQEKIALYYSRLAPEAQKVFSDMTWLETLREISEKYKLNEDQIQTLGTETMLVLLGIIGLNEYEKNLTTEIKIPKYSLDEMVVKIDDLILKDIRPQLIQAYENNNQPEEESSETKNEAGFDYDDELYKISQENGLTVAQMDILSNSISGLMNGEMPSYKFAESLGGLNLEKDKLEKLIGEINEKILVEVRKERMPSYVEMKEAENEENQIDLNNIDDIGIKNKEEIKSVEELEKTPELEAPTEEEIKESKGKEEVKKETKSETADMHSILMQKLSSSFKMPKVETEHTLGNLSKSAEMPAEKPAVDPYRETIQ